MNYRRGHSIQAASSNVLVQRDVVTVIVGST